MLLSLLDKCLFWQEIASWLARELSKVVPENIFLVFSTTYKRHASIWMLSKEKTIQKLRNFLRSGGKKLRSWLQALLRMLYINVFTHLSTFECATSCAVDQKVRFPEQGQNE